MRLISTLLISISLSCAAALAGDVPDYVTKAVNDTARSEKDRARDADRKPAEILAMTEVKPGDRVVDVGPGSSFYYTHMFSRIVGDKGHVYAFNPTWVAEKFPKAIEGVVAAATQYSNLESSVQPMDGIKFDKPVDVVFMSQLYHDQHWQKIDIAKMNTAIMAALKPGGVYFVIDHVGQGVTTVEQIDKLHRIDPSIVKREILAAGFELVSESDLLRNPADPGTLNVFDPKIRGKTDQFVFKFRKPIG